jgi:PIN domain nuclease of toxin-antitoxin system
MKVLLDTHVFLWYITKNSKLPPAYLAAIRDPANEVYLSTASVWESVVKHSLGKLPLPQPPAEYMPRKRAAHGIESLAVDEGAMPHLASLPSIHRDPFDRILVAQSMQHAMTIASVDAELRKYPAAFLPIN